MQFHLYRRVPASGQISVTLALTGLGVAYFDDVRIEPLVVGAASAKPAPGTAAGSVPIPRPPAPSAYRPQ